MQTPTELLLVVDVEREFRQVMGFVKKWMLLQFGGALTKFSESCVAIHWQEAGEVRARKNRMKQ